MNAADIPRGTPSIASRQPLAVAVATGRKGDRGSPVDRHRFFLVNARADGKGKDAVRHPHPAFPGFNALATDDATRAAHDAKRASLRGILVHASEAECFWTNYRAQTLPGHEHPKMAPSCQGNADRAQRWMPATGAYADIPCPGDQCQYRQPGMRNGRETRSPCTPYACLVFQLRFENMPCLLAKYESRGHGTSGQIKGFFEDIARQAAALHVDNPSLYGIPFVLDLSQRSNAAKQAKWFEVTMSTDFPPGMTLQQFLLLQATERGQLVSKAPLLIGQSPTVIDVMTDDGEAGNIGGGP